MQQVGDAKPWGLLIMKITKCGLKGFMWRGDTLKANDETECTLSSRSVLYVRRLIFHWGKNLHLQVIFCVLIEMKYFILHSP